MEEIKGKIKEYNQTVYDLFNEDGDYDYYKLSDLVLVTDEDIINLENLIGITIRGELKDFYKKMGRLINEKNSESYCLQIKEPKRLITDTKANFTDVNKLSFGLIDILIAYWGFNRPEFQNYGEYENGLTEKETNYINNNYKCFGHWIDDDIIEGAYFLFFDKKGNFGEIYYHQDNFDHTAVELKKLISNGITKSHSLEFILSNALETAKQTMIEWKE
jgi:hypothetical protein